MLSANYFQTIYKKGNLSLLSLKNAQFIIDPRENQVPLINLSKSEGDLMCYQLSSNTNYTGNFL